MVDIYKFEEELNRELLKEIENKYKEGKIEEKIYVQLKERYEKKLENAQKRIEAGDYPRAIKISGSQKLTEDTLKFSGSAHLKGGKINKNVKISGSGRIEGDIECIDLKCSGSLTAHGNLMLFGNLKSSGSFTSDGSIKARGNVKFSASANIGENLLAGGSTESSGSFRCNGYLKTGRDIKMSGSTIIGDFIDSEGYLKCSGSLSCVNQVIALSGVDLSGGAQIGGHLTSAKNIEISGRFEVGKNVQGYDISLNFEKSFFGKILSKKKKSIVEGSVLGLNQVELDNIFVNGDVAGDTINIGPSSIIKGNVFYVSDIEINEEAQISNKPVKITESELKEYRSLNDKVEEELDK